MREGNLRCGNRKWLVTRSVTNLGLLLLMEAWLDSRPRMTKFYRGDRKSVV